MLETMKTRNIAKVVFGQQHAMGDMYVRQPLPSEKVSYLDPFVLLHHGQNEIPEDFNLKHSGVGPHPHRGFAPVTFVYEGGVHHQDSRGNSGTVYKGGVQWMNAGMGIIHSERPAVSGLQEIIQMWVNSPAKHKMDQPAYFPLREADAPKYLSDDKLVELSIISGSLLHIQGPIPTLSPINSAMILGKKGGKTALTFSESHNAFLYVLDGKIKINDREITAFHMVVFENNGEGFEIEILEDTKALFMSGEPIGETIVAQGPFVVNEDIQIAQAYRDYRMGKMGILVEE
jgi:redox-sensitive bicupin YhaK (pirin superfamily)